MDFIALEEIKNFIYSALSSIGVKKFNQLDISDANNTANETIKKGITLYNQHEKFKVAENINDCETEKIPTSEKNLDSKHYLNIDEMLDEIYNKGMSESVKMVADRLKQMKESTGLNVN
jgi:uncharacterized protein (DUF2164 family)